LVDLQENTADAEMGRELSYTAAMCLLRGQVYEAQENRLRAVRWYKAALRIDPFCYEAFKASLLMLVCALRIRSACMPFIINPLHGDRSAARQMSTHLSKR